MELAFFSAVAAADANFLDGVQANNVTKELTRTTGIEVGGEGDDVQGSPVIFFRIARSFPVLEKGGIATTERTLQIVCRRWGRNYDRGDTSQKSLHRLAGDSQIS